MKILLFTDNLGAGGAQRQLVGLAVLLKSEGYDVKVCTYGNKDFYKDYLDSNNVPFEIIPNAVKHYSRIFAVYSYFRKERPDWVIAYQETPSLVACIVKIMGVKFRLIVSERSLTQTLRFRERTRFSLYRVADSIVPNSYSQGDFIQKKYPMLKSKITVVSNFVDLNTFHPNSHSRSELRRIIIVGSIISVKNVKRVIEAITILKQRGVKCIIEWFGITYTVSEANKRYLEECQSLIQELHLENEFILKEKISDIQNAYCNADYLCLPSLVEGTPNVICEAMACGLPIICSDVSDNSRYVKIGENGFLFNPQDVNDIANNIEQALNIDDMTYSSYCKQSRAKAEQLLSEDLFLHKYKAILMSE